ncbi:MAG: hypothetical protein WC998_00610 [Candidatus Paceibacterota bacterium]|jgi:hypothetical protein
MDYYKGMKVIVEFETPQSFMGFSSTFTAKKIEFTPDALGEDSKGKFLRWGNFSANFWFNAGCGKTRATTCANAIKRLKGLTKRPAKFYYEIEDKEN